MTTIDSSRSTTDNFSLPLYDSEDQIRQEVEAERERLVTEAGLKVGPITHFKRPTEQNFGRAERGQVTVLIGGLTMRHDRLILAGLEGLGYKVALITTPVKADFQAGKEYGNNGQCNPTYFTVGALVNHLKDLRDNQGVPTDQILKDHVFVTAGACGPCRFGMYEAEFRLALRNSGFDGFRVLLFQQGGGFNQAEVEAGLEFNLNFFLSLLNAMFMGDLLNEVAYQIRPYETEAGKTNELLTKCMALCDQKLREKSYDDIHGGRFSELISKMLPLSGGDDVQKFIEQIKAEYYVDAFRECKEWINDELEVDYTRAKPIVKVTGEFWAQTTEGDGNFNMFPFLEGEGAEVLVEPVATWIAYMLNQTKMKHADGRGLEDGASVPDKWNLKKKLELEKQYRKSQMTLGLASKMLTREYDRLRNALGGTAHALVDQPELVRLGHPYYNSRSGGGEGHLEVAKNIYYSNKDMAHMVLSLKPFGCMPSTQSDGAQAAVVSKYTDMIFLPIETSGEGDVNAHSRVQMALGEAKIKSKAEFNEAVKRAGYTIEEIRAYVANHRELRRPIQDIPHHKGVVGKAANFVLHVSALMDADPNVSKTKTTTHEPVSV